MGCWAARERGFGRVWVSGAAGTRERYGSSGEGALWRMGWDG